MFDRVLNASGLGLFNPILHWRWKLFPFRDKPSRESLKQKPVGIY